MNKKILDKGLIQVYTGSGKGKTTAAFGLCWRMLGRGGSVYICQFLKPADMVTGESALSEIIGNDITNRFCHDRADYHWNMAKADDPDQKKMAAVRIHEAIEKTKKLLKSGLYDLIILDEIIVCYSMKLVDYDTIKSLTKLKAAHTELVMTGRGADEKIIELADLVTEMKEVKHPYANGIQARKGIEY